jgi:hypothetical protein
MKMKATSIANLLKGESGTYFARVRINGKLRWLTLETKAFSIAKLRLPDYIHTGNGSYEGRSREA